jgi:hypothetical protein
MVMNENEDVEIYITELSQYSTGSTKENHEIPHLRSQCCRKHLNRTLIKVIATTIQFCITVKNWKRNVKFCGWCSEYDQFYLNKCRFNFNTVPVNADVLS